MRQNVRKNTAEFPSYFTSFGIPVLLLGGLLLLRNGLQTLTYARYPLSKLPEPELSVIDTPGPLVLATESPSVLGFGTFDPFEVIEAVNDERSKSGVRPLRANDTLMKAAQLRAQTIIENEHFSHQDPFDNVELGTVLPKLQYHFVYASENIGMGGNTGRDFVDGFMNSTSHRTNLLNPQLTDTGVAVADGPFGRYYVNIVVQIFTIPGGIDEWRGYSLQDRQFFETQYAAVSMKLEPVTWWLLSLSDPDAYSAEKKSELSSQNDILKELVTVMRSEVPLENRHVAMIRQYNALLSGP